MKQVPGWTTSAKQRAIKKLYYKKNKARLVAYYKEYHKAKYPERRNKLIAATRKWQAENAEKRAAYGKAYYQKNKEKLKAYAREWKKNKPEDYRKRKKKKAEKFIFPLRTYRENLVKRNRRIVKLFLEGKGLKELSVQFNLNQETIRIILNANGINYGRIKQKETEKRNKLIAKDYKNEISIPEIAAKWNLGKDTVSRVLKGMKVYDPLNTPVKNRNRKIIADLRRGLSKNTIAKKYGVKRHSISGIAVANGIRQRRVRGTVRHLIIEQLKRGIQPLKISKKYEIHPVYVYSIRSQWQAGKIK